MPEDSILNTIKKLLGIDPGYTHFDQDIKIAINTSFNTLTQIGVGPSSGFSIKDAETTWVDFLKDEVLLEQVKTYIFLKAKMIFDPPQSSVVTECYNNMIRELEWRLNVQEDKEVVTNDL